MSNLPPPPPPGDPNQPPSYDPGQGGYGQSAPPPGGYGQPGYGGGSGNPATNGLAIGSLVVSILGLLGNCFCFGGILSPVGLVLGFMGKKKADNSGGAVGGRGMALAGIIIGALGTLIFVAWVAFFIYAIATGEEINYQYGTDMG
jgi:Domain of unknown function (DUF4190)